MRTFAVSAAVAFVTSWGVALIMATGPRSECVCTSSIPLPSRPPRLILDSQIQTT